MSNCPNTIVAQHIEIDIRHFLQAHSDKSEYDSLFSLSPLTSSDEHEDDIEMGYGPLFSLSPLTSDDEKENDVDMGKPFTASTPQNPRNVAQSQSEAPTPAATSTSTGDSTASKRQAKNKKRSHKNREKKRQSAKQSNCGYSKVKDINFTRHVRHAHIVRAEPYLLSSKAVSTGYTGKDDKTRPNVHYTLADLVGNESTFKFKLLPWDGKTTMPLVDNQGTIFGVCAGCLADKDWQNICATAANALETRRERSHVPLQQRLNNRRGDFINLSCGVSHGGGQKAPKTLKHSTQNAAVLEELNGMGCFKRIAGFGSNVMATWAPDLHDYYSDRLGRLFCHDPSLKCNFSNSTLPAATYNMGPQITCMKHVDFGNLAFGWCAITALGSYNPELGGHLVLWDCGLVIEFPPGATILIPSAILSHSNTAISEGETRYSFAQYAAGGLFRWVENGFKKAEVQKASLDPWGHVMSELRDKTRWRFGISLLSNVNDTCFQGAGSAREEA